VRTSYELAPHFFIHNRCAQISPEAWSKGAGFR
jgi:hypothetical protein